ncbi:PD-(D/E)XK motif protein [Enterococcus durans]|uniref:PD-(D/E)XK motif protein n=1 Tax=Enterococcus durans TaxID=53345 RepID=UPI001883EE03|nr:PD-(D/E)XK motif protein [Enterococcus durans]MBE9888456.1 PD-(D/E)XK motif protein [Enterococcus durans]
MSVDSFVLIPQVKATRVYMGIDNRGMESIAIDFKSRPDFELMTNKISSRIVSINDTRRLFISLVDDDSTTKEIFEVFSKDIISSIEDANTELEVLSIIANRFKYWTELFKRPKGTYDEKWIQGFCGELWFLDNILMDKIGSDEAIISWTGPERANQDFVTTDKVFEVKTKLQQNDTIRISNENQLSRDMYLAVIELSKSSEISTEAINLNKLILSIMNKINNPKVHGEFNRKLLELDLFPIVNAKIYDKFSYEFVSLIYYEIDSKFPFIDHKNVPSAIMRYSYELSLNCINELKLSEEEIWK